MKVLLEMPSIKTSIYYIQSRRRISTNMQKMKCCMMYFYSAFNHVDQFFKVLSDIALGKVIITKVLVILS